MELRDQLSPAVEHGQNFVRLLRRQADIHPRHAEITVSLQAIGILGGAAHPGDFKAQARAALQCLKAQVEAGGGTMANIVKVNTYLTDIRHRADLVPIRQEILGPRSPASTLVAVAGLAHPDFLIEIEAIAVL